MLNLFKRAKDEDKNSQSKEKDVGATPTQNSQNKATGVVDDSLKSEVESLKVEVDRIKALVEGFEELRKSFSEQFSHFSEQIGELRSMILDRDRTIKEIELRAIKAGDLVESVQPEKMMSKLAEEEAKIEALKANLEGNESIMERIIEEIKETRRKIEFLGSVEEIVKLSEEIKKDLMEIKRIEAKVNVQADKVETLYMEIKGRFKEIDNFRSELDDLTVKVNQNFKDISLIRDKMMGLADKADVERLVEKVQKYIEVLKSLEKKSSLMRDVEQLKNLLDTIK